LAALSVRRSAADTTAQAITAIGQETKLGFTNAMITQG